MEAVNSMIGQLEQFAIDAGCGASLEAMRPRFARWERHLRARGHTAVPNLRLAHGWSFAEIQAGNDIDRLINEAGTGPHSKRVAHELRNLTGIRPYKP
jgi:hypothetical protein